MSILTRTKSTPRPKAESSSPIFDAGPSPANLADPSSFWHIADADTRAEYLAQVGDPVKYHDLSRQWDARLNERSTTFYREQARRDAGMADSSKSNKLWSTPEKEHAWPPAITDDGLSYYVHHHYRSRAAQRIRTQRRHAEQVAGHALVHGCHCCQDVDTAVVSVGGQDLVLCSTCAPLVIAEHARRHQGDLVNGARRSDLVAGVVDTLTPRQA